VLASRRDEYTAPFAVMESRRHDMVIAHRVKKGISAYNDKVFQTSPWASRPLGHWRNDPVQTMLHERLGGGRVGGSPQVVRVVLSFLMPAGYCPRKWVSGVDA
jgi:hypothetical protein